MAWPAGGIPTTALDSGSDAPALARPALLAAVSAVNDMADARGAPDGVASLDGSGKVPADQLSNAMPTGAGMDFWGSTAPAGWVLASGRTIGNGSSSATERANADCQALFLLLWTSMADAQAPVSGGRGASAMADWSANKTIGLPDKRGRATVGKDDMGGTAANRLTAGGSGVAGNTLGASGGAQTHTLITAEMPAHTHDGNGMTNRNTASGGSDQVLIKNATANALAPAVNSTGGGGAHNNTQPSIVANYIIKL